MNNLSNFLPYAAFLFFAISVILFIVVTLQKRQVGIPSGKIIYTDTRHWARLEKPLYDPHLRLTGKPDYLVEQKEQVIPIEIKSARAPQAPYDSHIFQLAAYCLLVHHVYGARPDYGIIHYPKRTFEVQFSPDLEASVRATIGEIQGRTVRTRADRSHENPQRCHHCGYRSVCDQSLRI